VARSSALSWLSLLPSLRACPKTSSSPCSGQRDGLARSWDLTEYTSYLVQEPVDLASPAPVLPREDQMGGVFNPTSQTGLQAFEPARASAKLSDSKSLGRCRGGGECSGR
jgi:hypothetical protein